MIKKAAYIPILFALSLTFVGARAQTLTFGRYTVEDGLPSSYLYDIEQDKEGFIWITTEGGICKFDGIRFNNNPIPDLASEEIINITFDSRERLWMNILNGQIAYHHKGKTYRLGPFPYETSTGQKGKLQVSHIKEDQNGKIWLMSKANRAIRLDSLAGEEIISQKTFYFPRHSARTMLEEGDRVSFIGADGISTMEGDSLHTAPFAKGEGQAAFAVRDKGKIIFTAFDKVKIFDPQTREVSSHFEEYKAILSKGVNSIFKDRAGNFWLPGKDGVLFLRKLPDGTFSSNHYLKDHFVSLVMQDRNDNYWLITQKKGLFFLPSTSINVVNKDFGLTSDMITAVTADGQGRIIAGCDDNSYNIISFDSNGQPNVLGNEKITRENHEIYDIMPHQNGETWIFTARGLHILPKGGLQLPSKKPVLATSFKVGRQAEDGTVWAGTSTSAGHLKNYRIIQALLDRTYSVMPISEKEAWIGSVDGLHYYKGDSPPPLVDNPELHTDIRDIRMQGNGKLWIATKSKGLFVFKNKRVVRHLTTEHGLPSNSCKAVMLDDHYAWIATNNGIARIGLKEYGIMVVDVNDGLPSREVNDIARAGDIIVAATNGGLAYFPDDLETRSAPPRLIVTSVRIAERDTGLHDVYELDYEHNNIKVNFVGIAYQSSKDLVYNIRLDGLDKDWLSNSTGTAEYPSLAAGHYTLHIRAKSSDSDWSEEASIQFVIEKPYWKKLWFYLLAALGLILLTGLVSYLVARNIQRRRAARARLNESRLTALRSQMNPHFMFNSLNSIQDFILSQDKRSANKYLSRFSRLMRGILEMSDKMSVPLSKELETLSLYLELEAMRFDGNLDYHIHVDEALDEEFTSLPSMLVQPYVENAIKHGLMHKASDRRLDIRFKNEGKYLVCEIDDNGIGREAAQKIKADNKHQHQSKAMSVTKERLELLNSNFKDELSVDILDKKHPDGSAAGTKVTIYIPHLCGEDED